MQQLALTVSKDFFTEVLPHSRESGDSAKPSCTHHHCTHRAPPGPPPAGPEPPGTQRAGSPRPTHSAPRLAAAARRPPMAAQRVQRQLLLPAPREEGPANNPLSTFCARDRVFGSLGLILTCLNTLNKAASALSIKLISSLGILTPGLVSSGVQHHL